MHACRSTLEDPTAVKITTSAGTQRTSKINFWGGLSELSTATVFRLEDCEQVLIENVAMNSSGSAAVHCLAGGNRSGTGAKGPSQVSVYACQVTGPTSAIQVDTATVLQVGALSPTGCTQTYKVENNQARIIETRPNLSEGTAKFASMCGAVEQTVVQRHTPPKTVAFQGDRVAWTDMPAGLTELNGAAGQRMWVDASRHIYARLVGTVVTAGATGSKLRLMYRTANGAFSTFASAGVTDIQLPIDATGAVKSPWIALAPGAKADVIFALGGVSGNGTADPVLGSLAVELY